MSGSSPWQISPSGLPPTASIHIRPLTLKDDLSEDPSRHRWWPQARGHTSPGKGLPPISPMKTCNLTCQSQKWCYWFLYPWANRIRTHLSSTPTTGMWEGCTTTVSFSDAMSILAGSDSAAYGVGLGCRRGTDDISTGRDAEGIKRSYCWFSSASSSHVTHLPYEPLGSIKVRKSVIIKKGLLFSWAFLPAPALFLSLVQINIKSLARAGQYNGIISP